MAVEYRFTGTGVIYSFTAPEKTVMAVERMQISLIPVHRTMLATKDRKANSDAVWGPGDSYYRPQHCALNNPNTRFLLGLSNQTFMLVHAAVLTSSFHRAPGIDDFRAVMSPLSQGHGPQFPLSSYSSDSFAEPQGNMIVIKKVASESSLVKLCFGFGKEKENFAEIILTDLHHRGATALMLSLPSHLVDFVSGYAHKMYCGYLANPTHRFSQNPIRLQFNGLLLHLP
ncbi:hypothetical protein BDQ17DRAFT_1323687 [Cyathus striatus]|nr:hypothetical protein BDQ17DRAFT_1323687 [Cyathus striatus]